MFEYESDFSCDLELDEDSPVKSRLWMHACIVQKGPLHTSRAGRLLKPVEKFQVSNEVPRRTSQRLIIKKQLEHLKVSPNPKRSDIIKPANDSNSLKFHQNRIGFEFKSPPKELRHLLLDIVSNISKMEIIISLNWNNFAPDPKELFEVLDGATRLAIFLEEKFPNLKEHTQLESEVENFKYQYFRAKTIIHIINKLLNRLGGNVDHPFYETIFAEELAKHLHLIRQFGCKMSLNCTSTEINKNQFQFSDSSIAIQSEMNTFLLQKTKPVRPILTYEKKGKRLGAILLDRRFIPYPSIQANKTSITVRASFVEGIVISPVSASLYSSSIAFSTACRYADVGNNFKESSNKQVTFADKNEYFMSYAESLWGLQFLPLSFSTDVGCMHTSAHTSSQTNVLTVEAAETNKNEDFVINGESKKDSEPSVCKLFEETPIEELENMVPERLLISNVYCPEPKTTKRIRQGKEKVKRCKREAVKMRKKNEDFVINEESKKDCEISVCKLHEETPIDKLKNIVPERIFISDDFFQVPKNTKSKRQKEENVKSHKREAVEVDVTNINQDFAINKESKKDSEPSACELLEETPVDQLKSMVPDNILISDVYCPLPKTTKGMRQRQKNVKRRAVEVDMTNINKDLVINGESKNKAETSVFKLHEETPIDQLKNMVPDTILISDVYCPVPKTTKRIRQGKEKVKRCKREAVETRNKNEDFVIDEESKKDCEASVCKIHEETLIEKLKNMVPNDFFQVPTNTKSKRRKKENVKSHKKGAVKVDVTNINEDFSINEESKKDCKASVCKVLEETPVDQLKYMVPDTILISDVYCPVPKNTIEIRQKQGNVESYKKGAVEGDLTNINEDFANNGESKKDVKASVCKRFEETSIEDLENMVPERLLIPNVDCPEPKTTKRIRQRKEKVKRYKREAVEVDVTNINQDFAINKESKKDSEPSVCKLLEETPVDQLKSMVPDKILISDVYCPLPKTTKGMKQGNKNFESYRREAVEVNVTNKNEEFIIKGQSKKDSDPSVCKLFEETPVDEHELKDMVPDVCSLVPKPTESERRGPEYASIFQNDVNANTLKNGSEIINSCNKAGYLHINSISKENFNIMEATHSQELMNTEQFMGNSIDINFSENDNYSQSVLEFDPDTCISLANISRRGRFETSGAFSCNVDFTDLNW